MYNKWTLINKSNSSILSSNLKLGKCIDNENIPEREAFYNSDSEKIYSILTNLVKNAIKFTDQGTIELGYTKIRKGLFGTGILRQRYWYT
jgi:signal transduction histidine kinase